MGSSKLRFALLAAGCAAAAVLAVAPGSAIAGAVDGKIRREGAKMLLPALDSRVMKDAGMEIEDYSLAVTNREGVEMRRYTRSGGISKDARETALRAAAAIDTLAAGFQSLTLRDIVSKLGAPAEFEVDDCGQRGTFFNAFYGSAHFFSKEESGKVLEIRFDSADRPAPPAPYRFKNALGIGSRIEDVYALLGQPVATIELEGSPVDRDRTLQVSKSGSLSYIKYASEGVRFFAYSDIVDAMYLFQPNVGGSSSATPVIRGDAKP
jgi:hypothetical protein